MIRALVDCFTSANIVQGYQINCSLFSWKIKQMVYIGKVAFCLLDGTHNIWEI